MNIILLCGGSGKRLYPLSNNIRSKQFLRLLKTKNGYMSIFKRNYELIDKKKNKNIIVATNALQKDYILLDTNLKDGNIILEPKRNDTFLAICLASAFLIDKKNIKDDECIGIFPSDIYVDKEYFECFNKAQAKLKNEDFNVLLLGVKAKEPSEKFGYIVPKNKSTKIKGIFDVKEFVEKPSKEVARKLIKNGALINGGAFCFKAKYIKEKIAEILDIKTNQYNTLLKNYKKLSKKSFDFEVLENESKIKVIQYNKTFEDLGTWESYSKYLEKNIGQSEQIKSSNSNMINELTIPVVGIGLTDTVVSASYDGILVTSKKESSNLKKHIEKISFVNERIMNEDRLWGSYKVLYNQKENNKNVLVKHIVIKKGKNISYQYHNNRDEHWTIIKGSGIFVLEGKARKVNVGDVLNIPAKKKHSIKALSELEFIETQIGSKLTEEDIFRITYDFPFKLSK